MPRMARVVVPGMPHHVTQRGNRPQTTFFCEADYALYLHLAAEAFQAVGVEVWAYCLMPNHVHLIATPPSTESLALALGRAHRAYTRHVNRRERWTGYLWQGRFASFPMDDDHLVNAVRYVGLNPVRAGLCAVTQAWPWSSVAAHLRGGGGDRWLTPGPVAALMADHPGLFEVDVEAEGLRRLRQAVSTGRALGASAWIKSLEASLGRSLQAAPPGRPRKAAAAINGMGVCSA